jgi:hypothetical protein
MKLDLGALGDPNKKAQLLEEFSKTIFGIKPLDSKGLKNNLYLSDITKIIVLQLAEQNFSSQIENYLENNATADTNGYYKEADIEKAIVMAKNSSIAQEFDPNNIDY